MNTNSIQRHDREPQMETGDNNIAVIGLGYVGLTLATVLSEVRFNVLGIEINDENCKRISSGVAPFREPGLDIRLKRVVDQDYLTIGNKLSSFKPQDVYIITVGTPLGENGLASTESIEVAARSIAEHMPDGALIILRSTVKIGTSRDVVGKILRESGKSFDLAMCPERTLEGKALEELRQLPQIVGAESLTAKDRASRLFSKLTKIIVPVSNLETAEVIKLIDNTYRDVQFAFANEVAQVCERVRVAAPEVISCGKLGYPRTSLPIPGLVGGPCLSKDPHILMQSVEDSSDLLHITRAARYINESQPRITASFIGKEALRRGLPDKLELALCGIAFKGVPETDDLRGSMTLKLIDELRLVFPDGTIRLFDPVIQPSDLKQRVGDEFLFPATLDECFSGIHILIIANNHPAFAILRPREMLEKMKHNAFIYDYWNHFSHLSRDEISKDYFSVGFNLQDSH